MTATRDVDSVADVRALLAAVDPDRRLVPFEIAEILRGREAAAGLATAVRSALPASGSASAAEVVLLVDRTRIERAGPDLKDADLKDADLKDADLKDSVQAQLEEHFRVRRVVLSDGHPELHVSEDVVAEAARATAGADAVVAVGGGTICDIGKLAALGEPRPALVVVQTAASVDGFTDNVSVLLRDGVKRTVPSRWPDVVVADAQVIGAAPAAMNRAGYGEMTSTFTAPADWRLANLMGLDPSFHRGPIALLEVAGRDLAGWSPGVGRAEPAALEQLTWVLALRGIATGVSGTTACLSGVEHLVSHMVDLHHGERRLPMGLHGAQVGVASVVAAAAWEMCFERLTSGPAPTPAAASLDDDAGYQRVERAFGELDPTGRIAAECWRDYARKLGACRSRLADIARVLQAWPDHEAELRSLVRPAAELGARLRSAGAAATFEELDPAVSPGLARWAVENSALMRNRFTVLDLLDLLGWWHPEDVTEVLARAAAAVPAANATTEDQGADRVG